MNCSKPLRNNQNITWQQEEAHPFNEARKIETRPIEKISKTYSGCEDLHLRFPLGFGLGVYEKSFGGAQGLEPEALPRSFIQRPDALLETYSKKSVNPARRRISGYHEPSTKAYYVISAVL
jgi:hypothetical protein